MYLYIKSLNIFPTFYIYVIIFYVTILIVNSPLKIFQIFQKIFKICILETGKKFWKKKKRIIAIKIRTMFENSMYWHICQSYLFYYTLIFRSRFHNKSETRLHSYRITSFIEMHCAMVFLLLFKGNTFYCARINRISLKSIVVKTVNSKFREYQEDF